LTVGIGDDAAVWQPSRSRRSVITTDALVEDVHFTRAAMSAADVGYRSLAVNLSDVAAMGARPVLATIALGVSSGDDEAWILEFYRGLIGLANASRTAIAGGDISRSPCIMISIAVVGEVRSTNCTLRSGARPGDVIAVTGALGASRAGLTIAVVRGDLRTLPEAERALAAYRRPAPRLAEGAWLGASRNVHAMMDLSDGLSTDLPRMSAASGCGALVEDVPVDPAAAAVAAATGSDPLAYALDGGEDFELLVAVEARAFGHLSRRFESRFGKPLHRVGTFSEGSGVQLRRDGSLSGLASGGWDHLSRRA
jgi:thiamine-monophosphate kinase